MHLKSLFGDTCGTSHCDLFAVPVWSGDSCSGGRCYSTLGLVLSFHMQISFAATASSLSDKDSYPFFLRTMASDRSVSLGIVALMKQFNWDRIGIITQQEDAFTGVCMHTCMQTHTHTHTPLDH